MSQIMRHMLLPSFRPNTCPARGMDIPRVVCGWRLWTALDSHTVDGCSVLFVKPWHSFKDSVPLFAAARVG
eukprot:1012866-Pelagomonas_calceolata.AAC.5